jgi:hypothetical protein
MGLREGMCGDPKECEEGADPRILRKRATVLDTLGGADESP